MTPELITFLFLALVAIATAIGMLLNRNSVYSALFLVMNFITVAIFYLLLGAPFIAMAQITVYAGAIMVLFLFVIMLLGAERLPDAKVLPRQKLFGYGLAAVLAVEAVILFVSRAKPAGNILPPEESANATSTLVELGKVLFSSYLLPFEVTSILLLVAMVGVIVLVHREKGVQK